MKAKTTPRLYLQDFAKNANSAVLSMAILLFLLVGTSLRSYAQSTGQSMIDSEALGEIFNSSNPAGLSPFNTDYKNSRSQYLYRNDELAPTEANELITHISFFIDSNAFGGDFTFSDFTIRMKQTGLVNFSAYEMDDNISESMIDCRSGAFTITAGQEKWIEIELDTPFPFVYANGNLIVEVAKTNDLSDNNFEVVGGIVNARRSRGARSKDHGSVQTLGINMKTTAPATAKTIGVTENNARRWRPDIKITYKGTTANSAASYYSPSSQPATYCLGDEIELEYKDLHGSSILLQWQSSPVDGTGPTWTDIPGATTTTLNITQQLAEVFYRCKRTFAGGGALVDETKSVSGVNTWNGSSWSRGSAPTSAETAYFKEDGDISTHAEYCSVVVADDALVTVEEGVTLKVGKNVVVAALGDLIFENNASLIQTDETAVNFGDIEYQRISKNLNRFDYTYYSSPVFEQNLFEVSSETLIDKFWSYEDDEWVLETNLTTMKPGKGYIIRGGQNIPVSGSPQDFLAKFKGVPNNGDVPVHINPTAGAFNLVGNPYPSAADTSLFLQDNNSILEGTVYFWKRQSGPSGTAVNGIYNYDDNNYVSVNWAGSTDGFAGAMVAAGQSFMVQSKGSLTDSTATWTNSHRRVNHVNVPFYKVQGTKPAKHHIARPTADGRFWLELQGGAGKYQRMLVAYIDGATDGYDDGLDGKHLQASNLGFYALEADQMELSILGKGMPFDDEQIIPVGFSTNVAGPMTIVKFLQDGFFSDYAVYINDKLTNTSHNLSESAYTFNSNAGTFNNRFVIAYKTKGVEVVDPTVRPNTVVLYDKAEALQLHSTEQSIKSVVVYDMSGRIIAKIAKCDSLEVALSSLPRTNKLILVEIQLENGTVETQKFQF